MDFSFNARTFRTLFHASVDEYVLSAPATDDENSPHNLVMAMEQAIDVMQRADSDAAVDSELAGGAVNSDDITRIGDYALSLLDVMASHIEESSGQPDRELMRLAIPVALWIEQHGGRIEQLDIVVNALAGYANNLHDTAHLAELCKVFSRVIAAAADDLKQDLEQTSPMRPWRILNLNYGIVATRSHDTQLIEQAYATLVKNLPQDARQFFREGMQQMEIIGYPQEVREVVEKYDSMWGADSTLH